MATDYGSNDPRRADGTYPGDDDRTVPVGRSVPADSAAARDREVTVERTDTVDERRSLREEVLSREHERFGGFQFGTAFFGWLTAMGATVLLAALVAAIGGAVGLASPNAIENATEAAAQDPGTATWIGAIALGLVLFIAYFIGGYVAGRMARFSGLKQGIAVWLWAIVVAAVVAIITALGGAQWDILSTIGGFPRIPVTPETATMTGILAAIGAAIVTLVAAILGGKAGTHYHRKVDRVGLGA
ncbi:hypothetical protein K0817_017050 [Microbacterium sp. HD4P20]|uniref:hypothetical protein n=1 Tax=Microbacterium sp. HD4P20 TaxID=2864874 RepID=UPI001C641953|nr:hypothetical protein [Microbacterium sp. HD4P20]MCP2638264.1 hypothetical protein [Microbacterium sp. HD4P20]